MFLSACGSAPGSTSVLAAMHSAGSLPLRAIAPSISCGASEALPRDVVALDEPATAGPEDHSLSISSDALLERCLGLLSEQQRQCIVLAFVDGSSHDEISQRTGSPLGTIKSWIRRGLQSLRQCLEP